MSPASPRLWLPTSLLLEKLGKLRPEPGARPADAHHLSVWLEACGIGDVIVHHAEVLDADALLALDAAVGDAGARCWCVIDPVFEPLAREILADAMIEERTWEAFRGHWSAHVFPPPPPPQPPVELRATGTWRDEFERLQHLAESEPMDAPYLVGFCAAAGWERDRQPKRITIASRLRGLLSTFHDPACFASAARGASIALRDAGWDVRLDLRRIAGDPAGERPPRHLPPLQLAHLRWFRDPLDVAAAALAGLELAREEALQIRLGDVAADASSIQLRTGALEVPAVARSLLRAQRIARRRQGAGPTEYFLADQTGPLSARTFTSTVLALLHEIGTRLPRAAIDRLPSEDERWLLERGIAFEWIVRTERPQRGHGGWHPDEIAEQVLLCLRDEVEAPAPHTCACATAHVPPSPEAAPAWPRPRPHAANGPNHPWRRSLRDGG